MFASWTLERGVQDLQNSGCSGFRMFMVQDVQGSGFGVSSRHRRATPLVQGSGFRVQGSGFRVQGSGFRVEC